MISVPHFSARTIRIALLLAATTIAAPLLYYSIQARFAPATTYAPVVTPSAPFIFSFNSDGILHETGSMTESSSPYWWVNSGAKLILKNSVGSTVQNDLPVLDAWRTRYAVSNPVDTDTGKHPQNIFRLITKAKAGNVRVEMDFKIERDQWSSSPNRNASNGLLLMSRYVDGNTLYYAGLRVDGQAVIKKKYKGSYYTLAQKQVYAGTYTSGGKTNLLPHGEWLTLRSETVLNADTSVTIRLYQKEGETWKKILEAKDSGQYGGTPPISGAGHTGVRTDFMDVSFESFKMEAL